MQTFYLTRNDDNEEVIQENCSSTSLEKEKRKNKTIKRIIFISLFIFISALVLLTTFIVFYLIPNRPDIQIQSIETVSVEKRRTGNIIPNRPDWTSLGVIVNVNVNLKMRNRYFFRLIFNDSKVTLKTLQTKQSIGTGSLEQITLEPKSETSIQFPLALTIAFGNDSGKEILSQCLKRKSFTVQIAIASSLKVNGVSVRAAFNRKQSVPCSSFASLLK